MTKFEKECYEALKRLKSAVKKGNKKRITRETVGAEAGKKPGAIRPIRHPELCLAIQQAEADRKAGILSVSKDEQAAYRETVDGQKDRIDKLEQENLDLSVKLEKQAEVILNLLHEINDLEEDLSSCEENLQTANSRIDILMEKVKPRGV
ncbi:MAG: hypothetical protein U9N57_09550 [Pseudomonadota bacterium]|nr:hypothetical protein [Pseudomonadota bacterium]